MSHAEGLHRRDFAWHCLGGIGALSVAVQPATGDDQPPPPALPEDPPAEPARQTPPVELLLLSALMQSYPSDQYTDDVLRGILRDLGGDVARGKHLRAFPLNNADEPALAFQAFRATPPAVEGIP